MSIQQKEFSRFVKLLHDNDCLEHVILIGSELNIREVERIADTLTKKDLRIFEKYCVEHDLKVVLSKDKEREPELER